MSQTDTCFPKIYIRTPLRAEYSSSVDEITEQGTKMLLLRKRNLFFNMLEGALQNEINGKDNYSKSE
ncbi:hypothetical protein QG37_03314 [Candidozyma auris]|uniref:Uncharacterized protein n=1 Tax=Candidozyma auris TaxID=498019 RepID=A0A0L0P0T4_CANAR|nr:hypothetical protein QG37_03314 [[Candida] auris]